MTHTHVLKTVQPYYDAVANGMKTFEVRTFDRPFEVGDPLLLREYTDGEYTGQAVQRIITYVMADPEFVLPGLVVLGIRPPNEDEASTLIAALRRVEEDLEASRP